MTRTEIVLAALALAAARASAGELVLHHADFHARTGMRIHVETEGAAGPLRAELTSDKGYRKVIHEKKGALGREESFALILKDLPGAKYTLTVRAGGRRAARTFDKPYDGVPMVGIDENNSLRVKGKLFFPVCPWFIGDTDEAIRKWDKYVNTLAGTTFSANRHTVRHWKSFLDLAAKHKKMVIGPARGHYWPNGGVTSTYRRNGRRGKDRAIRMEGLVEYVKASIGHPAMLFYNWKDEPELSNKRNCHPPAEVRRWTDKCHELDPQHPVFMNNGGYGYDRPEGNWMRKHQKSYTYLFNGIEGRRVLLADVISQDYYPIEYELDAKKKGYTVNVEGMCRAMDTMRAWNRDLPPFCAAVETCDIRGRGTPAPTAKQVRMLCWANIVHGARTIIWFHYFRPTPPENFREMARFLDQVTRLTPAVLGPDYAGKVTDSEQGGGRVDVMVKEAEGAVWIFAVNVRKQPADARFSLDFAAGKAEVFDEKRSIEVRGRSFSDRFGPYEVHIYRIRL